MQKVQKVFNFEIIADCSEIHTACINIPHWQNVQFVNVKPTGSYANRSPLDFKRLIQYTLNYLIIIVIIIIVY